jgi:hypothetical protein
VWMLLHQKGCTHSVSSGLVRPSILYLQCDWIHPDWVDFVLGCLDMW